LKHFVFILSLHSHVFCCFLFPKPDSKPSKKKPKPVPKPKPEPKKKRGGGKKKALEQSESESESEPEPEDEPKEESEEEPVKCVKRKTAQKTGGSKKNGGGDKKAAPEEPKNKKKSKEQPPKQPPKKSDKNAPPAQPEPEQPLPWDGFELIHLSLLCTWWAGPVTEEEKEREPSNFSLVEKVNTITKTKKWHTELLEHIMWEQTKDDHDCLRSAVKELLLHLGGGTKFRHNWSCKTLCNTLIAKLPQCCDKLHVTDTRMCRLLKAFDDPSRLSKELRARNLLDNELDPDNELHPDHSLLQLNVTNQSCS